MTPMLLPFIWRSLLHAPTFCRMLCGPNVSIGSDSDPKLMPKEKNQFAKRKICSHTIPFASLKSPFGPQLRSQETPSVSQLFMEDQHCLWRNQRQAALFGMNAGHPLSDMTPKRVNSLAVVEGMQSHSF